MSELSQEYWDRIGTGVMEELERRLGQDGRAADLPGTLLLRFAEAYLKYLDKRAANADPEIYYMTAMEAIDQEGLPPETKIEILSSYIEKLEEDMAEAVKRLSELVREVGERDGTAVHGEEPPAV